MQGQERQCPCDRKNHISRDVYSGSGKEGKVNIHVLFYITKGRGGGGEGGRGGGKASGSTST